MGWPGSSPRRRCTLSTTRRASEADSNHATFLAAWDRLFGSFQPASAPHAIGLDGMDTGRHQTLAGLLFTP
jgi:sterol desaturase/sphingolipid hydroxylase (fatty acid hydroxylase superfamily)